MFVAEIGINHNGNLGFALQLIANAAELGIEVVKFQKRNVRKLIPESDCDKIRKSTPWGDIRYIDYKENIEFGKEEYDAIDKYCRELGAMWTASVWDVDSLDFILQYDIPFIKIASASITNVELLTAINEKVDNVLMSVGMSTEEQIKKALSILDRPYVELLWCNSNYPSKDEEIDLNAIPVLQKKFNLNVGYSGHETDDLPTILAATIHGVNVIERHVTLDKRMWGSDQSASLDPDELQAVMSKLGRIKTIMGKGEITCYPSEKKIAEKLRKKD